MNRIVRNISIIAHIDHGKTTMTDRLLLMTGTITEREFTERLLDSNPIEQERGITIKMAPVTMTYTLPSDLAEKWKSEEALINLIDTPGHVDFSYEVSRSLAAVEGAILLIDATQGIQAQTLSHYYKAMEQKLTIIPVLNKVDLINADVDGVKLELMELFGFEEDEFIKVSAKTGYGITDLFNAIIERIPAPPSNDKDPLRALIFNSFYHSHKGVIVSTRVMSGVMSATSSLKMMAVGTHFIPQEVGVYKPHLLATNELRAGDVGYIATGLKDIRQARVGDTVSTIDHPENLLPLPGYQLPQLMVYMDFYPIDGGQYAELLDAMEKFTLNDSAIQYQPTYSPALGNGLRLGFLGILHAEIVRERMKREYNLELITTAPSVRYEVELTDKRQLIVKNAAELPDPSTITRIHEPMAEIRIYTPKEYLGDVMQLTENHRGTLKNMEYIGQRSKLTYDIPLAEIIVTYFDELKSVSSGFASIDYEITGYQPVRAVKLSIIINYEAIEALSQIVVMDKAEEVGKTMVSKLKEVIPRQLFAIPIQAAIGGKVIARETVKAFRKDVTAKLYGGDVTRRMKLLEKQKKGKKRRGQFGKVDIPQEAFMAVLKR